MWLVSSPFLCFYVFVHVQDVSQRCLDACTHVVAASLENTAWLRRSMAITASHLTQSDSVDSVSSVAGMSDVSGSGREVASSTSSSPDVPSQETPLVGSYAASAADYVVIGSDSGRATPPLTSKVPSAEKIKTGQCQGLCLMVN